METPRLGKTVLFDTLAEYEFRTTVDPNAEPIEEIAEDLNQCKGLLAEISEERLLAMDLILQIADGELCGMLKTSRQRKDENMLEPQTSQRF